MRNQLACYLQGILSLMYLCKFSWAGAASVGIHLTLPFMNILLDHRVTPRRLLTFLPCLYNDLITRPISLLSFERCAFLSLNELILAASVWERNSLYGVDVCLKLQDYISTCDEQAMLQHLKLNCNRLGEILKRQRGDQYNFGFNEYSPILVTKIVIKTWPQT